MTGFGWQKAIKFVGAMAGMGHEERFLPPGLSAGRGFSKETFTGVRAMRSMRREADLDHVEVELGPLEYLRSTGQRVLLTPDLTLNYGFTPGWEAVLEGQTAHGLSATVPRTGQIGDEFSLKTVLRDGVLQDPIMGPARALPGSCRNDGGRSRCI
jgi:hypothetical protein